MDSVEFVERICWVKLFEYQKELLRECEKKRDIYLVYPPRAGRTNFTILRHMMMTAYFEQVEKEKKNERNIRTFMDDILPYCR